MMPQIENRCIHRLRLLIDSSNNSSNRDAILDYTNQTFNDAEHLIKKR